MRFATALFLLTLGGAAPAAFSQSPGSKAAAPDEIVWLDNYQQALQAAKATGKPIFLEFRCEP